MNTVNAARLDLVKKLSARVRQAPSWSELESICADINTVFLAGKLTAEGLEALCVYIAQRARTISCRLDDLPEGYQTASGPACDCCGSLAFRHSGSQAICAVCHPDPLRHAPRRRAA